MAQESHQEIGPITEMYTDFANEISSHQNFEARRKMAVPFDVSLEQYVAYCKERAQENYTNDLERDAQERFAKYRALLD